MRYANLEKSFFFININKDNSWRTSTKSLLVNLTDNKKYYLTKECRAEHIGQYPFLHQSQSEFCIIFEDKKYSRKLLPETGKLLLKLKVWHLLLIVSGTKLISEFNKKNIDDALVSSNVFKKAAQASLFRSSILLIIINLWLYLDE